MKKPLTALVTISLLFALVPFVGSVSAAQTVSGLIKSDTVWHEGTYTLTGPVGVLDGATLIIEPGVTIDFASYYIQVNGTLNAQGTSSKNIRFTSTGYNYQNSASIQNVVQFMEYSTDWNDQTASGCVIQNAFFQSVGVSIQDSSPKISRNTFNQTSINVRKGSPIITCNYLYAAGATTAIQALECSATITNNYLKGTGYQYGVVISGSTIFSDNVVDFCWDGVQATDQAVCKGNTITNCYDSGISCGFNSVTISQNYIAYNSKFGISGVGNIESNTIINNKVGVQVSSDAGVTLKNNNIYGNTDNNLQLTGSKNVDASNNYWGTTNSDSIAQKIRDASDDFNLGTVTYSPFLSTTSLSAPTAPLVAIVTPTPKPTADYYGAYPTGTPQPTIYSDWMTSIGSFANGANTQLQSYIVQLAQVVLSGLAVGWAIVLGVVARRRANIRRKNSKKPNAD